MKANILTLAITLTVGIILAGSLLAPVISDTTATHETLTNEGGLYTLDKINANEDFTLEWEYTTPTQIKVNSESIQLSQGNYPLTVFFNESLMVRVTWNDGISVFETLPTTGAFVLISSGISSSNNMIITNSDGTLTLTNGSTTVTRTNSDGMIASNGGAYLMKSGAEQVYLTGDSEYYASGYTYRALSGVQNTSFVGIFKGTIDGGLTPISFVPNTYEISDVVQTYTQETGTYQDLYKFTGFSFTLSDGTNTGNVSYNQIIVPVEVSAELSNHLDDGQIAMMNTIPILIIVSLIVMAAGALYLRRTD